MKLRFWRREKKRHDTKAIIDKLNKGESIQGKIEFIPLDDETIIASDDNIFGIENQCLGTAKKTGKRCERITPLGYCWQHPQKGEKTNEI